MHPLIRLTSLDGGPVFWSGIADLITSSPRGTVIQAIDLSHDRKITLWAQVRETVEEVERLRSEAMRPITLPAIDLEAVAPEDLQAARTVLAVLAGNVDYNWCAVDVEMFKARLCDTLHTPGGDWHDVATALRNLAARLGGAS